MTRMLQEIFEQPKVLKDCLEDDRIIKAIIEAISKREVNNVVIAARGTSDNAGIYGKYIIEHKIGLPVSMAAPSIHTLYESDINYTNTLVIGISQSGEAQDVLEVIKSANRQNAITIGITNYENSPIAKISKFHLFTNAGIEKSVAATKTFTAQLMMLAMLVTEWAQDKESKMKLYEVPKNIQKLFSVERFIEKIAERYKYMDECFVLSRGTNYAIALEFALKVQETAYVKAKAYSISDFHHGPFAMIDENELVIVFAPKGVTLKDTTVMIDKLKNAKAELIIISNDKEILEKSSIAFEIPNSENDLITPFYNIIISQIFACKLSLIKGLNPDEPRGLKKVTITR